MSLDSKHRKLSINPVANLTKTSEKYFLEKKFRLFSAKSTRK